MGWWDNVIKTVSSTISSAVKKVNEGIANVERATGIDIPGVGTDLSKERKKKEESKKKPSPSKPTPKPVPPTQSAPIRQGTETKPTTSSHTVFHEIVKHVSHVGSHVERAINEGIANVERATGIDIPGVGTTLKEEEKEKAPVQQYIQQEQQVLPKYGVGLTYKASQLVEKTVKPPGQVKSVVDFGKRVIASAGATFLGGLAFMPDTIVNEAQALGKVATSVTKVVTGKPQEAKEEFLTGVRQAVRPVTYTALGVGSLLATAGKVGAGISEIQKENLEAVYHIATGKKREFIQDVQEMARAQQRTVTPLADLIGSAVGIYGLGKAYSTIGTHASNVKTWVKSKTWGRSTYLKPKEIRVYYEPTKMGGVGKEVYIEKMGRVHIVEDSTVPTSLARLQSLEGKTVRGVHMTISPEMAKYLKSEKPFILRGFPEQAKGFRKAYDMLHFYISSPDKGGTPRAYGFYAGISKGAERLSWSLKSLFTLKRPNPQMVVVEGKVNTPSILYKMGKQFRGTGSYGTLITQKGDVILKNMSIIQGRQAGRIQVPVENIAQAGPWHYEGQLIIPAQFKSTITGETFPGTVIKPQKVGWTIYTKVRPSTGSRIFDFLREVVSPTKRYEVEIYKAGIVGVGEATTGKAGVVGSTGKLPIVDMSPEYYSGRVPATVFDIGRVSGTIGAGGRFGISERPPRSPTGPTTFTPPRRDKPRKDIIPDRMPEPERMPEPVKPSPPIIPEPGREPEPRPPEPRPPKPRAVIRPIRRNGGGTPPPPPEEPPRRRDEEPPTPPPPPREPPRERDRIIPTIQPIEPERPRPQFRFTPLFTRPTARREMAFQRLKQLRLTMPKGKMPRGKISKSLLADIISVMESQIWFGRATHPKPTKRIWKMAEKTLFMKVPTKELMRMKRKPEMLGPMRRSGGLNLFGSKKKSKKRRRR